MLKRLLTMVLFISLSHLLIAKSDPNDRLLKVTNDTKVAYFHLPRLVKQQQANAKAYKDPYFEYLRTPSMSAGLYVLPVGAKDAQQPHTVSEIYYVISGKAKIEVEDDTHDVKHGSIIFVRKNTRHHFYDITKKLTVLVMLAPADKTPTILWLYHKGLNAQQIVDVLGVNLATVNDIIQRLGGNAS